MRQIHVLLSLLAAALPKAQAEPQTAAIYIQPVHSGAESVKPTPLAELTYDVSSAIDADDGSASSSSAEVTSFEAPELPEGARLVRIGLYDPKAGEWTSSTSVASVESLGRGYSPHFVLSLGPATAAGGKADEAQGREHHQHHPVLGVSLRGVRVDAGATRDFGPQAVVVVSELGRQPALNKPVVISPEGKQVPPEEEKSILQKYWWLIGLGLFLVLSGGGQEK